MPTPANTRRRTGGHAVVDCWHTEGVRHVFNVPGASCTSILDGLRDVKEIQLIANRQEGGACLMAEAYAKATRTPGVCVVTRGPGATNARLGVHWARHDSTPLVVLVGQVERAARGREAGQEIDYSHVFGSLATGVIEVDDPRRLPAVLSRAFPRARSGRPGPVVVSLPRALLAETADIPLVEPSPVLRAHPEPGVIQEQTTLSPETIHPVDAGNCALWIHTYQDFRAPDTCCGPTVGCMGDGVPAAVGAQLAHPHRVPSAHGGDGGFWMTGQEMATAAQYGINIITVGYNNGALATLRMHQEAQYPKRPSGTDCVNPDFAALGTAYRALGIKVTRDNEFLPALQEALKANQPALIEVMTDLEYISPTATLSQGTAGQPGR